MGVPRFFSWVNKNYNVVIDPINNPNELYLVCWCSYYVVNHTNIVNIYNLTKDIKHSTRD
jgi:5'-3' exonuclease